MVQALLSLLQPHIVLYLLMVGGLVWLWRTRPAIPRGRLLCLSVPFVLLSILFVPAVTYLIMGSLEWAYPPLVRRPPDIEAIVVLSGYVKPPDAVHPEPELGESTLYRCVRTAALYRQGPRCPVLVSGGRSGSSLVPGPTCAEAMRDILVHLGVHPADVILEDRSLSTYENAVFSARLLHERGLERVVLVTDATHLWRSESCFRKQGIAVVPCGCYYRATHFDADLADFLPNPAASIGLERVTHEWLGLAWYWLRGKI
jgi:uncharacterized SAM-binding protein YcdF (DUF218 family)